MSAPEQPREPSRWDRRRVRVTLEFDVSLDGFSAGETGPSPFPIVDRIGHAAAATVGGMRGVLDKPHFTHMSLTDPPREREA